jgi:Na+/H+ antiporter NhaD/arsenite permease-like protein
METVTTTFTFDMLIAALVMAACYVLIFTEVIHRTNAAIIGSVLMIVVGMAAGFYSQEAAIRAIDANTLLLLAGMMMIVAMLRHTGAFEYVAIRITKLAKGNNRLLLVYLGLLVVVTSMLLDNVTTIIVFAPLTVLICRILNVSPMPYLVTEALFSNIGGMATLVGDPPNIMIGSVAGISFMRFLVHMGPPVMITLVCTAVFLLFFFRRELGVKARGPVDLDENRAIKDGSALWRILFSLGLIVILFFVHHRLHLYPAYVSFIGLALALALLRPGPEDIFAEVNWSVLIFFAGLYIIVGGVEGSGLLDLLGYKLAALAGEPGMMLVTGLLVMWVAAFLSAIVDNIPFTVTMIPIILGLETQGVNITPLWWALALGVGLGGNGTHIGSTTNIIVVAESEKAGMPDAVITPSKWLRIGLPAMLLGLVAASLVYAAFFSFFY